MGKKANFMKIERNIADLFQLYCEKHAVMMEDIVYRRKLLKLTDDDYYIRSHSDDEDSVSISDEDEDIDIDMDNDVIISELESRMSEIRKKIFKKTKIIFDCFLVQLNNGVCIHSEQYSSVKFNDDGTYDEYTKCSNCGFCKSCCDEHVRIWLGIAKKAIEEYEQIHVKK